MATLKKLTTLLGIASITFVLFGCCGLRQDQIQILSEFPPAPQLIEYTVDPVISYDEKKQTYVITEEYMNNSLQNDIFVREIKRWKTDNGIR